MKKRTGRPPSKYPKNERMVVRYGAIECAILEKYCESNQVNRAEATRRGIRKLALESKKEQTQ